MIKIISKVLSIHLRGKINELVSDRQTAFVDGQVIFKALSLLQELFLIAGALVSKVFFARLTLKRLLTVSWNFLFGFDKRWIPSSTSALVINNAVGSWFPNRRGLKQGNPLSFFSFYFDR